MKRCRYTPGTLVILLITVTLTACTTKNITQQKEFSGSEATPSPIQKLEREKTSKETPPPIQKLEREQTSIVTPIPKTVKKKNKKTKIGSYSTILLDKDPDRINNISIAANEIDGYIVQPNEVFSFNAVVGKRKAEKGYEKARILVKGKGKKGIGGGICQLSSTLYNAVDKAGLKVIERHSHSKDVHYVPKGRDAAVSYKSQDFKFRNTKSYPIKIKASIDNKKVYVSIYKA